MLQDESGLIARAQKGGRDAFGKLYDHYLPKIYRFVFLKVTNREEAEDICHQVFLSAWQNIHSYQEVGYPFSSWLYRIARNAVIDFYRTKKQHTDLEDVVDLIPSDADTSAQTEATLASERVLRAMARLNEDQRELLVMRYVEELDNKEIKSILGKSEGAIRILQFRAIKNLQRVLAEESLKDTYI